MRLLDYKLRLELSFTQISEETGIPRTILCRGCNDANYCWKLLHAHTLVKWSMGSIGYEDLLPLEGDC